MATKSSKTARTAKMNGAVTFAMIFKELYTQAILSQGSGVLGVFLVDNTKTDFERKTYYNISDVRSEDWNEKNYKYLADLAFKGVPKKVIAIRIQPHDSGAFPDMTHLNNPYDYASRTCDIATYPGGNPEEQNALVSMIKADRAINAELNPFQKCIKLFTGGATSPDSPHVINIKQKHTVNSTEYTAAEYALCLAGCTCGIGFEGSMTFYKQPWVESVEDAGDVNEAVGNGYLITVADSDGDNVIYRTERGINSFVTPSETMGRTFSKIRNIMLMDQHLKDIQYSYKNYYIGKKDNDYEGKMAFCGAVNAYLKSWITQGKLDSGYENSMKIDYEAQINWALANGKITEEEAKTMDEYTALRLNTKDQGFYTILDYCPVDVMEDAQVIVEVK